MFRQLRSKATNLAAKLLLAMLVLSFSVWGVGDMLRHPSRNTPVATVGGKTITYDEYEKTLRRETDNVHRALGDRYSPELVKNLNLGDRVLRSLINQSLLSSETEAMGFIPSDADVVRRIRNNPAFQDARGNFDKIIFEAMLSNSRQSEKSYVDRLRREMANNLIADTLTAHVPVPEAAVEAIYRIRGEERAVSLYRLGPALAGVIPKPDAAQLEAYYHAHERDFSAPEYRTISYVTISVPDMKAAGAALSEEQLKKAYHDRLEEFRRPEQRVVEHLLYAEEEQAKKAAALMRGGAGLKEVAQSTAVLNKNSQSLGSVTRNTLMEEAAAPVFALKSGEVTDPIKSQFGWHVFHVSKVEPPSVLSFDAARPQLEKDLAQHGADDALNALTNKLEDALAGGSSLKEITAELGLKLHSVGPVDHRGYTLEGNPSKDIPALDKFMEVAFKTDEKTESPLISSKGMYYLLRVDQVTPPRIRTLDEVRGLAMERWQEEERAARLEKAVRGIAKEMAANPAAQGEVIARHGLQGTSVILKRDSQTADGIFLSQPFVADVFARKVGESTDVYPMPNGSYLLAVLRNTVPAAALPEDAAKRREALSDIRREVEADMENEILTEYMRSLTDKYTLSVNRELLQAAGQ